MTLSGIWSNAERRHSRRYKRQETLAFTLVAFQGATTFPWARIFGRVGKDELVDVEPAWPIGMATWISPGTRGSENTESLETGYTPSGRIVPMHFATVGDHVEMLYTRRRLDTGNNYNADAGLRQHLSRLVHALERAVAQSRD